MQIDCLYCRNTASNILKKEEIKTLSKAEVNLKQTRQTTSKTLYSYRFSIKNKNLKECKIKRTKQIFQKSKEKKNTSLKGKKSGKN